MKLKINDKVLVKRHLCKIWGYEKSSGVIVGKDPRGLNKDVFAVRMDGAAPNSYFETYGVHKTNFSKVK